MKDYWLVIDPETMHIEICFPDCEMYNINACLATINGSEIERILEILKGLKPGTEKFRLTYEYFTLDIDYYNIEFSFHMFEDVVSHYLYTQVMIPALTEYLHEYEKLARGVE
jgi:hypothetical protein